MYKILLCCVSGVTTNKLVKAVKESAKQKDIKVMCWAVGSKSVGLSWADADCVLLAPQSASELSKFEEMALPDSAFLFQPGHLSGPYKPISGF